MNHISRYVFAAMMALLANCHVGTGQSYDLRYGISDGQALSYKNLVNEDTYLELHTNLSTSVKKNSEIHYSLKGIASPEGTVEYVFVQDTNYVRELPPPPDNPDEIDMDNLLTKIPVQIRLTEKGEPLDVKALESAIGRKGLQGKIQLNDRQIAQFALTLPVLPAQPIEVGDSWEVSTSDTLVPRRDLGEANSLRLERSKALYKATGLKTIGKYECVVVEWDADVITEQKTIEGGLEQFFEETTSTTGEYCFAPEAGLVVEMSQRVELEATTVIFGDQEGMILNTSTKESELTLIQ
ncbi:MAG: hypothetical protein CL946_09245 [Ectothiorhodospiraceae bacterium]|nr:hypothetical protein [Ectothiorhodospiraceae bacterium]